MARTMPGARWAAGLLAWLGMFLSVQAQSNLAPVPPPSPSPPTVSAELADPTAEESQITDISNPQTPSRAAPKPFLVPTPSEGAPAGTPIPASQAMALPERWPLMRLMQGTWAGIALEDARTQVYGWTQGSFTASTDSHSDLPIGFNYKANQFLLQQNWLRIDRTVINSDTTEPTFGYRFDTILPGSDYFFTLPYGLGNTRGLYGIDPVQFYGEAYFPTIAQGMDVKVGRFFSQYGVELISTVDNPFISHSYSFIYDPFTQAGILTTTKLNESYAVQAGLVMGNDNLNGATGDPTFVGSVKWTGSDQRNSLAGYVIADDGRFNRRHDFHNPEIVDVVGTHKISSRLLYTFDGLYGFTSNVPDIGFANWLGIVNYLTYNVTSQVNAAARLDFFDDFQGQRTGFAGLYIAPAVVAGYRPVPWLQFRQEIRYDYHTQTAPFEGKHGLFTATSDFVLRW